MNSPQMLNVFARIAGERIRQRKLIGSGRILVACESPTVNDDRKLRVVIEEVGEVAQEIDLCEGLTRGRKESHAQFTVRYNRQRKKLQNELTQVAAVTVAWLESLEVTP